MASSSKNDSSSEDSVFKVVPSSVAWFFGALCLIVISFCIFALTYVIRLDPSQLSLITNYTTIFKDIGLGAFALIGAFIGLAFTFAQAASARRSSIAAAAAVQVSIEKEDRERKISTSTLQNSIISQAITNLGHVALPVKLGGVAVLSKIAQSSTENHAVVLPVLASFLNYSFFELSKSPESSNESLVSGAINALFSIDLEELEKAIAIRVGPGLICGYRFRSGAFDSVEFNVVEWSRCHFSGDLACFRFRDVVFLNCKLDMILFSRTQTYGKLTFSGGKIERLFWFEHETPVALEVLNNYASALKIRRLQTTLFRLVSSDVLNFELYGVNFGVVLIKDSRIENGYVVGVTFESARIYDSDFLDVVFVNCSFKYISYKNVRFHRCSFVNCHVGQRRSEDLKFIECNSMRTEDSKNSDQFLPSKSYAPQISGDDITQVDVVFGIKWTV